MDNETKIKKGYRPFLLEKMYDGMMTWPGDKEGAWSARIVNHILVLYKIGSTKRKKWERGGDRKTSPLVAFPLDDLFYGLSLVDILSVGIGKIKICLEGFPCLSIHLWSVVLTVRHHPVSGYSQIPEMVGLESLGRAPLNV